MCCWSGTAAPRPSTALTRSCAATGWQRRKLRYEDDEPRSILFVVPGQRRLANLRELCADLNREGTWPIMATTAAESAGSGPLAPIWQRLDVDESHPMLTELPTRRDLVDIDPRSALGRRWRHDCPGFWERLSPLGRVPAAATAGDLRPSGIAGFMDDPEANEEGSWR